MHASGQLTRDRGAGGQRTHPVLIAELDPEGVLDGLGGGAVSAAGVAHEDEDVLGAVGPKLDELDGALLLLPEGLVVVVGPAERGDGGGCGGVPAGPARGGELAAGVGEALAQLPPGPLLVVVRRHGLQHRLPDRPPPWRRHGRRHRGRGAEEPRRARGEGKRRMCGRRGEAGRGGAGRGGEGGEWAGERRGSLKLGIGRAAEGARGAPS